MGYKTILTVITQTGQIAQLESAIALARREDAHLEVFALGVDRTQTGYYYAGASAYVFQEAVDRAMATAEAIEAEMREQLSHEDIRWSLDSAVAQIGGLSSLVAMRARYVDLVVQTQPYGPDAAPDAEGVVEAALFEGGAPALILPHGTELGDSIGKRVLIGWNQSDEALHAVRRAMSLLKMAESVEIAVVDPSPHSPEGSDPGGRLCQMLTRHGVKANIAVLAKTLPTVTEVLQRRAIETGADMMVIGAYSKSRLREAILGGVTRRMLENAPLPVLMAR